ncbi:hypothetical protein B5K08_26205 [Rhizobium leguminosarum bv. trifolii]|uniref:Cytochrome c-552/DMSO reductase-like haem-binding domain-containing protein n=1 Tax=Rhizobium leguminosarum bv. trifolii TaxID=386 RepID=A0A3E1B4B9_RHILT|nr:ethylbenzene dehydrogenase-related protein [Rhizobium leguminosarum]RFB85513.1 hypothetical protein B5K08_26205 [Rhizobium leguminosarum bv. trifolii]RFB85639.1 hypothetical protein B5K10_27195 [Rhizobium leguminosarum bv. trifolii]
MTTDKWHPHPMLYAAAVACVVAIGITAAFFLMQPILRFASIDKRQAPLLDGDTSDEIWIRAEPVSALTAHGGDFGGSGETRVEIRALHDNENVYLAFVWSDPTRSFKHLPLVKEDGQWRLAQTQEAAADVEGGAYEDRLAIMLSPPGAFLIGGAIHLGVNPLPSKLGSLSKRGLHFVHTGVRLDVWEWRAVSSGLSGWVQDRHLGPPIEPTAEQLAGHQRYEGGFVVDEDEIPSELNFRSSFAGQSVKPLRLPAMAGSLQTAERLNLLAHHSKSAEDIRYWGLRKTESVAYSPAIDAQIPDGAVLPGLLINDDKPVPEGEPQCAADWAVGFWTLECRRSIISADRDDLTFSSGMLMWLAPFDHAQTRHSYHLRPIKLELE